MEKLKPGKYKVIDDIDVRGFESGTYIFVVEAGGAVIIRTAPFTDCPPDFEPDIVATGALSTTD